MADPDPVASASPASSPPPILDASAREKIARANIANIIKKAQAGKTLTRAELDLIAGAPSAQEKKAEHEVRKARDGSHTKERAEYWGCKLRTMQIMIKDGIPVDSDAAMVEWYCRLPGRSQRMLTDSFRSRINAVRAKLEGRGDGSVGGAAQGAVAPDKDLDDFKEQYKPGVVDDRDSLADIRRERAYYLFKMQRARARRDSATESDAARQFRSFSDVLHDAELRALKMGRDLGESYSAEDVKRLGRAIGFWLMQSADTVITQCAKELTEAAAAGPLDREAVRRVVEPTILRERVVAPMVRASKMEAGVSLPKVFVEAVRAGLEAVVEVPSAGRDMAGQNLAST